MTKWRATIGGMAIALSGCSKEPAIVCGPGTELRGNMCVVAQPAAVPSAPEAAQAAAPVPVDAPSDATSTGWQYETHHDKMRNEDTYIAKLKSTNSEMIGGEPTRVLMLISKTGKDPAPFVVFIAEHGQLLCRSLLCVRARFDEGDVTPWPAEVSEQGPIVITGTPKAKSDWLKLVRSSSNAIVEFEFRGEGRRQFTFSLPGLVWEQAGPPPAAPATGAPPASPSSR